MIDILASLHKYGPTVSTTKNVLVDGKTDEIVEVFKSIARSVYYYPIVHVCIYIYT